MENISDLGEVSIDTQEGLPQDEIEIDRQRAYSFGVNVYTVANEINACIEGTSSTVYRKDGEDYTVYVMLRPQDRQKVIDLEQIYVSGTNGLVNVANFAKAVKGFLDVGAPVLFVEVIFPFLPVIRITQLFTGRGK